MTDPCAAAVAAQSVGGEVRNAVERVYPDHPTIEVRAAAAGACWL